MKRIFLLIIAMLLSSSRLLPAEQSLFEEKRKDAASSVVIDVEEDRPITGTENRKFVQSQPDYVKDKLKEFDEKLAQLNARIDKLQQEIKDLATEKD